MQFKHPELLYLLFLLLIPILVHLFQLRKFQKTAFTNVAFLKEIVIQTRKSSQIKKWLTLMSRLLFLACIILSFSQPYKTQKEHNFSEVETVIYIDNSLSMQAKGPQGELLKNAIQKLYENPYLPKNVSWFSNSNFSKNQDKESFRSELLQIDYSGESLTTNEVILKAESLFSKNPAITKNLIWISDFQNVTHLPESDQTQLSISTVQLTPISSSNTAIDSMYIESVNSSTYTLGVIIKNYGKLVENLPVSLFKDSNLVAKTSCSVSENASNIVYFDINQNSPFYGKVSIPDENLYFDNELYFTFNQLSKINVLEIKSGTINFLNKIFTPDEFNFNSQSINQLDYNILQDQNTIIINALEEIPEVLQTSLKVFEEAGGTLVIIPSSQTNTKNYNLLFNSLKWDTYGEIIPIEKQLTKIHYSHPIYQNVFENEVVNFQYPSIKNSYSIQGNSTPVLAFEDGTPLLSNIKNGYLFAADLSLENSNFIQSPLVVPTFYRIAKKSMPLPELYYTIGKNNTYGFSIQLPQDHILNLKNENYNAIPLQQNTLNKVIITTTDQPDKAGNYQVYDKESFIGSVSYNYNRNESNLNYFDTKNWNPAKSFNTIETMFEKIAENQNNQPLWKWFAIFALVFLIIEMLLLKFIP